MIHAGRPAIDRERAGRQHVTYPNLLGGADATGPEWAVRARGPYLWDEAGDRYHDFVLAFGAVILGHAEPGVTRAVIEQVKRGVSPTLRSNRQQELEALITELVPNAERVILLKTGSDATAAAVRIARAHTGRTHILRWGYQGWHDWCAPRPAGVPAGYRALTHELPFNDVEALGDLFARYREDVAAVAVMPSDGHTLDREYLLECRRLADRHGALFILDEVRTGFRLALGGAQAYFGVDADLVALSKAMANGHPISAVTGRAEVMRVVGEISMSSVFFRSTDGMAAALATLTALRDTDALPVAWRRGEELQEGMRAAAAKTGAPVRVIGLAPMPFHEFVLAGADLRLAKRAFYRSVWRAGHLLHPSHHWFTCASMTSTGVRRTVRAITDGYRAVVAALR